MQLLEDIASQLGLQKQEENTFSGVHQGYPVAVSTFGEPSSGQWGLLFQVRHPRTSDELPDEQQYHWPEELEERIGRDLAKVDIEERIAWLSIYDVAPQTPSDSVIHMLNALLAGLQGAGVQSVGETCHYCLQKPGNLEFLHGRVLQICEDCLDKYLHQRAVLARATGVGITQAWGWGVAAAALGAILWAGFWFTFEWVMSGLSRGREGFILLVPGLSGVFVALGIGALVGIPVGYVLRRIPNRGTHAAKVAICCVSAGTLLGEALFVTLWFYYVERILFFSLQFLWAFWMEAGVGYLGPKVAAAILGMAIAHGMVRVETRRPI